MIIFAVVADRRTKGDLKVHEVFLYTDYGLAHDMLTRLLNQHGFDSGFIETCELIVE